MKKLILALLCLSLIAAAPKRKHTEGGIVTDATNKFVGYVGPLGWGNIAQLAYRSLNGITVGLPATQEGFVDNATTQIPGGFLVNYESTDCSGEPMVPLGTVFNQLTGQPVTWSPLVQSTTNNGTVSVYIFNNVVYFAGKPVSVISAQSQKLFLDPVNDTPECQSLRPTSVLGGPVTQFDLSTLKLSPPFSVKP